MFYVFSKDRIMALALALLPAFVHATDSCQAEDISSLLALRAHAEKGDFHSVPNEAEMVTDYDGNPIIQPPGPANWIVGDPTVLQIKDEIFMWTMGATCCIQMYKAHAKDPYNFTLLGNVINDLGTVRPYAFLNADETEVTLFYEQYQPPYTGKLCKTYITAAVAKVGVWDFIKTDKILLKPELPWQESNDLTKNCPKRVGNPFVFYNSVVGKYWMYYSAGSVYLTDSQIDEPYRLGLAQADELLGTYTFVDQEPLIIEGGIPGLEIIGYGSLKLIKGPSGMIDESGRGVALCNRITQNGTVTGSTMSLIHTMDGGLSWSTSIAKFIGPDFIAGSWKEAYVYAYDTLPDPQDPENMLVYYNGRNGYKGAYEQVGTSKFPLSTVLSAREGTM